jgi:CopG family nickel-responsive transcriptional regulator
MTIVSLSINDTLLKKFDDVLGEKGFATRSEAFRDVIRSFVNESEWEKGFGYL